MRGRGKSLNSKAPATPPALLNPARSDAQAAAGATSQGPPVPPLSQRRRVQARTATYFAAGTSVLAVVFSTLFLIRVQYRQSIAAWEGREVNIADQKAKILSTWLEERKGDAETIAMLPGVEGLLPRGSARRTLPVPSAEVRGVVIAVLDQIVGAHGYVGAYVLDPRGRTVIHSAGSPALSHEAQQVARSVARQARFGTEALQGGSQRGFFVFGTPILPATTGHERAAPGSEGVALLLVNPSLDPFPSFVSESIPTRTGEIVLVHRVGSEVVFLSPVRHTQAGTAELRHPFSDRTLAARAALEGHRTFGEFTDYRGARVLAATRQIPLTGWGVVSKIDRDEVLEGFHRIMALEVAAAASLVVAVVLGVAVYRRGVLARVLREEEENLRNLFESAPDAAVVIDRYGRLIMVNSLAERMFGYGREEMIGQRCEMLVPDQLRGEQPAWFWRAIAELHSPETSNGVELAARRKDGSEFAVELTLGRLRTPAGDLVSAALRDVTARKRAEEAEAAARKIEVQYRGLFEHMCEGLAYCRMVLEGGAGRDFVYLAVNTAFETLTGLKDVTGKRVTEVIPGIQESDPGLLESYARVALTGVPEKFETFVDALGMWFSISLFSPEKEFFVAIFDVITERKRTEAALRLRTKALDAAANGVVIADREGTIVWANAAATALTGYTSDELVGKNPRILKSGRHNEAFYQHLWRTILSGQVWHGELVNRRKDGNLYTEEMTITPVQDHAGEIAQFIAIKLDVTERRRAQEEVRKLNEELDQRVKTRTVELEAANREMEAFTYSVSHDLRAPLRHINAFVDILIEDYGPSLDATARAHLERVRSAAASMGHLVDGLLKLSRLGRHPLTRRLTALGPLVVEAVEEVKLDLKEREIEWRIGLLPTVECDPDLVRQVFMNLLSNAVKYTEPRQHAVIVVDQTVTDGRPVFFVRDNGVGFDMQYADNLFGVFQRLHRAGQFDGTGVGLATVQRIINKHGGRVWAEAEPDQGATFYFTLTDLTERRHAERWSAEKRATLRIESNQSRMCHDAVTVNLSARGARVRGNMGLSPGQAVDLNTEEDWPHFVPAQVVWVKQRGPEGRSEAGLRFLEPTDLAPGMLAAYSVAEKTPA